MKILLELDDNHIVKLNQVLEVAGKQSLDAAAVCLEFRQMIRSAIAQAHEQEQAE